MCVCICVILYNYHFKKHSLLKLKEKATTVCQFSCCSKKNIGSLRTDLSLTANFRVRGGEMSRGKL